MLTGRQATGGWVTVGEILAGRFELLDVLDSGGAGTIWRAWDHQDDCYVAAKVLRHSDDESVIRFVQESRRIIDHPHITAPRNWIGIDDKILFTMDLIAGGSVATLLRDFGSLPEGWITVLAAQAAAALGAVHAARIAHRDIKPANLLLEATGIATPHLRLSDFGTAARVDGPRLTMTSAVVGTTGYLSPEARHGAGPSPLQDIYALGITMGDMATGTVPDDPRRPPDNVSPALGDLIAAMTAHDPADRPPSAADVEARLRELPGAGDLGYAADPANPIEIYHQIPPLPAGWTPTGPARRRNRATPHTSTTPRPISPSQPARMQRDTGATATPVRAQPGVQPATPSADSAIHTVRSPRRLQLLAAITLAVLGIALLALAVQLA